MRRGLVAAGTVLAASLIIERVRSATASSRVSESRSQREPEAYCLRCKGIRYILDPHAFQMKNLGVGVKGSCPACGSSLVSIARGSRECSNTFWRSLIGHEWCGAEGSGAGADRRLFFSLLERKESPKAPALASERYGASRLGLYTSGTVMTLGGGLLLKLYSTNIRIRNGVWQTDY